MEEKDGTIYIKNIKIEGKIFKLEDIKNIVRLLEDSKTSKGGTIEISISFENGEIIKNSKKELLDNIILKREIIDKISCSWYVGYNSRMSFTLNMKHNSSEFEIYSDEYEFYNSKLNQIQRNIQMIQNQNKIWKFFSKFSSWLLICILIILLIFFPLYLTFGFIGIKISKSMTIIMLYFIPFVSLFCSYFIQNYFAKIFPSIAIDFGADSVNISKTIKKNWVVICFGFIILNFVFPIIANIISTYFIS